MSLPRLVASLALLCAACNPQTPHGGDDPTPPDAGAATDASIDVPDVDAPPPVEPPGRAVEVVNGAGRLSASAGARTYTFDVVIGGSPRGRAGDGTRTLDAAPVLR
jgi:hypothetical protein